MVSYLSDENVKKRLRQQEKRNELQKLLEQKKWLEDQLEMHARIEEETQQQEHKTRISFLAQQKNTFEYISRKSIFRPYHNPYNQGNPRRMKPRPPREEVERATEMSTYQLRYCEARSLLGFLLVGAAEARNEEQKEMRKGKRGKRSHSHDRDRDRDSLKSSSIEMFHSDSESPDKSSMEVEMRQRLRNRFKSSHTSSKNAHSGSDNDAQ